MSKDKARERSYQNIETNILAASELRDIIDAVLKAYDEDDSKLIVEALKKIRIKDFLAGCQASREMMRCETCKHNKLANGMVLYCVRLGMRKDWLPDNFGCILHEEKE